METTSHKSLNNPAQIAEFLRLPVSINLAVCGDKRYPSLARGLACRFDASNLELCLYVSEISAKKLLADLKPHLRLAAVFCLPSTEQTIQIKCRVEKLRTAEADERRLIERACSQFAKEVADFGLSRDFVDHFLYAEKCMAIITQATEFYEQTPGPLAGSILKCQP
ncbi:hypothetical protein [Methylomonas sp. MgM2]